jgi:alkyl sulfatase BDS1-like metallo-beta-lactamase superfamily hydrolase
MKRLTGYMDQLTLIYDQTLRGILGGLTPAEIRHAIHIPEHMREIPENAQSYGETIHFPEAIYNYVIGWFDGDVTELFKIAPQEEAERMVQLIGGVDKVYAAAQQALEEQEYAWGAQVIQYAYLLDPRDQKVRQLKADLLRAMGYRTTGSIARAFLLTEALALEGELTYPTLYPPSKETIAAAPETFVDYFRVRIDPKESEEIDNVIEFVFADKGDLAVALHVRRGIAEFIPMPANYYKSAAFSLKLDSETWADLYLSAISLSDAVEQGKVKITGDAEAAEKLFSVFDVFEPTKNYRVPPVEVQH